MKNVMKKGVLKKVLGVVATLALLYGLVIVPTLDMARAQAAFERVERSVFYSCELQARTVLAQLNQQAEEPIEESQQEQVLNGEFSTCVLTQGFEVETLVSKYANQDQ